MRIVVIGGTGFIGAHVARQLHERGHAVTVFHRGQTLADLPAEIRHIQGDRHVLADAAADLRRVAPEVVLDMNPMTEQDAEATVRTFTGIARRLVVISSQDVYRAYGRVIGSEPGPPDPIPLAEDAPLRERLYPYRGEQPRPADDPERWMDEYDKILVERAAQNDATLPTTILRLSAVYGPGDRQHRLFEYVKRMDDGRSAILLDEAISGWRWTRGYVANVAAAIVLAVTDDRAAGRIYNVGETKALSIAEWVWCIGQVAGWSGAVEVLSKDRLPAHLVAGIDGAQHLLTSSARIRADLGYAEPVTLDQALRRTIAWERAHPPERVDPRAFDYAAEDAAVAAL